MPMKQELHNLIITIQKIFKFTNVMEINYTFEMSGKNPCQCSLEFVSFQ